MGTPAKNITKQPVLLREDDGVISTLTLNRPAQYNALSEEMLNALQMELDALKQDDSIQVVILAAKGKAFCAGHDLKQMRANQDKAYFQNLFARCTKVMLGFLELPQPVIARVQGMATAAGLQLVANSDLAIAATDVKFAVSGINLGLFCSTPGVALSRNVPRKRAFEMLFTGQFIDAETAVEWDLINDAVPSDQLDHKVMELAERIAAKPPIAIRTGKKMFYKQLSKDLPNAYDYAGDVMACNMTHEHTIEGVDAFLEKRDPSWKK